MSSNDTDYMESVGEYTTLKTAVGAAQPSRIRTDDAGDSEELASSIAQRKTGNPSMYERLPADAYNESSGEGKPRTPKDRGSHSNKQDDAKGQDGDDKEPGGIGKFLRVPLIVAGVALAILGAVLLSKKEDREVKLDSDDIYRD